MSHIATALYSSVMLLMLWYMGHLWRDYRIQAFRQDLFEIRSKLFEYARAGYIGFNDPVYRSFRTHANALIRYAYHVNFSTLLTALAFNIASRKEETGGLSDAITGHKGLSVEQRNELLGLYGKMILRCVWQIASTSIFAWPCAVALGFSFFLQQLHGRIKLMLDVNGKAEPSVMSIAPIPERMVRHVQALELQAIIQMNTITTA